MLPELEQMKILILYHSVACSSPFFSWTSHDADSFFLRIRVICPSLYWKKKWNKKWVHRVIAVKCHIINICVLLTPKDGISLWKQVILWWCLLGYIYICTRQAWLAYYINSLQVDISSHLYRLSWHRANQSFFLTPSCCMLRKSRKCLLLILSRNWLLSLTTNHTSKLVSSCCLMPNENFFSYMYITAWTSYIWKDDNDVHFVQDQVEFL